MDPDNPTARRLPLVDNKPMGLNAEDDERTTGFAGRRGLSTPDCPTGMRKMVGGPNPDISEVWLRSLPGYWRKPAQ